MKMEKKKKYGLLINVWMSEIGIWVGGGRGCIMALLVNVIVSYPYG